MTKHEPEYIRIPDAEKLYDEEERWQSVLEKWREIVRIYEAGNIPTNIHGKSCAFCIYYEDGENDCYTEDESCPIYKETGDVQCFGTPFHRVAQNRDDPELALPHARKMLTFLENLYEKTHPKPIQRVPFTDFFDKKLELAVVRGCFGHDHLYLLKNGKPICYLHVILNFEDVDDSNEDKAVTVYSFDPLPQDVKKLDP